MSFVKRIQWWLRDASPEAQRIRRAIKILFIVLLFAGLFWIIPVQQVLRAIAAADPVLLSLGILLGFISTLLTAFELHPLTRKAGIQRTPWDILSINLAVKFYTQFTPTSIIGSGLRWYRLSQPGGKSAEALAALAFFRMLETFLTFALGLGFWLAGGQQSAAETAVWLLILALSMIAAWIAITRLSLPAYKVFKQRSKWMEAPALKPILRRLEKFLAAVSAFAGISNFDLAQAVFWGVASVMAGVASGVLIAQSVGIDIGFMQMGWIQAVVLLATQLPFAAAGGLGIREVTLVALLAAFDVPADLALAFSFLLFVRGLLISLLGGVTEGVRALRLRQSAPQPVVPHSHKES